MMFCFPLFVSEPCLKYPEERERMLEKLYSRERDPMYELCIEIVSALGSLREVDKDLKLLFANMAITDDPKKISDAIQVYTLVSKEFGIRNELWETIRKIK